MDCLQWRPSGRHRAVGLARDLAPKQINANDRRLAAEEWKSGTDMRIIDIVAPFSGEMEMREQIRSRSMSHRMTSASK